MTSRVLVADDSLTIQKVIGITLANSGYELVECLNESDLLRKIQSNHFDLILLDFNLSDSRSGYDLAKQINQAMPGAAIIVMLGTFDTVDESQFDACGISDKIVKPFESTKFIKKCRDLLEGKREMPAPKKQASPEAELSKIADIDLWKVDAPQINLKDEIESADKLEDIVSNQTAALDPLSSEISGWGFTPQPSLEEKYQKAFPPVIEEASETINVIDRFQSSSHFIKDEEQSIDLDETDPSFLVPEDLKRDLLNEIDDDISPEAFWAVDEVVPVKSEEEKYIEETNLDDVTADLTETVQNFKNQESAHFNDVHEETLELQNDVAPVYSVPAAINTDELVEKLKVQLRPMIEEMVKEFCRQSAEKVAWEVIPDLAENLIRKEIKEISDSVQH